MSDYQGWQNRETWTVVLWLRNDAGAALYWAQRGAELADVDALAAELKEWHTEQVDALAPGVFADLLTAALGSVAWADVAAALQEGEL